MKRIIIVSFVILIITIGFFQYERHLPKGAPAYEELDRPGYVSDQQWQRWMMKGGTIDPQKRISAKKMIKERVDKLKKTHNDKDGGLRSYVNFGPRNIGGRIRAIALQPDGNGGENIFIGAAGGGLWRSTNGGDNWTPNSDVDYSLAITSIVVAPSDPDIIYASTGEGQVATTMGIPGAGIFKSIDGGDSWEQLPSTANEQFYWCNNCLLYTSPSPRDRQKSRMPSSA